MRAREARTLRVPDAELGELLRDATSRHAPPTRRGKRLRFYGGTQTGVAPPSFAFTVSDTQAVHFSYRRYLENLMREKWGFDGTPIRFAFRGREEAAESARRRRKEPREGS
jgi:GTP-binding protein